MKPPCARCQIEPWPDEPPPVLVRCPTCSIGLCAHHAAESPEECPRCLVSWTAPADQVGILRQIIAGVVEHPNLSRVEAKPVMVLIDRAGALGLTRIQINKAVAIGRVRRRHMDLAHDAALIARAVTR